MVDFFIRRPIFATVSAPFDAPDRRDLRLPAADRAVSPDHAALRSRSRIDLHRAPSAQVRGPDTVASPIEQQVNGTKGMIYYNSDSTSNGVSNIVATFDVGYSQDMAAVDIQNKRLRRPRPAIAAGGEAISA